MTKDANKIDLGLFDTVKAHNKPAMVELEISVGPKAGQPSGLFISILGKDSDVAREFNRKQYNVWRQKAQAAKKRGRTIDLDSAEVLEEKSIEMVTRLTVGWSENMPSAFSPEVARDLYTKYPDIRQQMDEAASAGANF